jgi:hypothetical protein
MCKYNVKLMERQNLYIILLFVLKSPESDLYQFPFPSPENNYTYYR